MPEPWLHYLSQSADLNRLLGQHSKDMNDIQQVLGVHGFVAKIIEWNNKILSDMTKPETTNNARTVYGPE